jgi:hypothetical protein
VQSPAVASRTTIFDHGLVRPELRRQAFMFALRSVRKTDGIFRDTYDRILANNGGRKMPALAAISRRALRLMFRVARERRLYIDGAAAVGSPE